MVFNKLANRVSNWYKNTFSREKNEQKALPREVSANHGIYGKRHIDTDRLQPKIIESQGELMYRLLNGESKPLEEIAAEKGLNLTGKNGDLAHLAYGDNQYIKTRKGVLDVVVQLATSDDYSFTDIEQEKRNLKRAATLLRKQYKIYKNSKDKDIFDITDADWQHAYDALALKSQQLHDNDTSTFSKWHGAYQLKFMDDQSKEKYVFFDKNREFDFNNSKKDIQYLNSLFVSQKHDYKSLLGAAKQHLHSLKRSELVLDQDQLINYERFLILLDSKTKEVYDSLSPEEALDIVKIRSNFVKCRDYQERNSGKHTSLANLVANTSHLNGNTLSVLDRMEMLVGQIDVANPDPRLIDDIRSAKGLHRRAENYLRENSRTHAVDTERWERIYALGEQLRTLESVLETRKESEELVQV